MRIEELIIEGFKSYPIRTQISGWDPSFNAITGLNGSGKSNILDAICFVLGMTNMSSMRAQNQQDLIYKRGQAGVTKASVTIVFDNSDRSKSPPGMEDNKQITVTRQIALPAVSKYLLNGHKSTQATVQTLFQSVQLNINNPHFLIMQGRITKVLNMRPQEILGMVEEAAGTRMFEERKDKAKKTMSKKEKRVQEIQADLEEEIMPKLEKQRAEKRAYIEYQKACSALERISRMLRAYEWTHAHDVAKEKQQAIQDKEEEDATIKNDKKRLEKECRNAEKQIQEVTKKKEAEITKGGKLKKLEEEVTELGKAAAKIRTQAELKENTIKEEQANVATVESELEELNSNKTSKAEEVNNLDAAFSKVKDQYTANQTKLSTAEELLQSLLTGLTSNANANTGGGYMGQLADARGRISQAEAEEQQSKVKLSMSDRDLKALEVRSREVAKEATENQKKLARVQAEVDECRRRLEASGWNAEMDQQGEEKLRAAKAEVRNLTEKYENLKRQLGRIDFNYSNPSPDFDRSKVKGPAAQLIHLDKAHFDKATALEIAAGGRLFQIVVETEKVGKDILERGQLRKRVTLIPLNKISARTLEQRKLHIAQQVAPGKVWSAISLVGYANEVAKAIAYVFGDNLICADSESAKKVTFHREIGVRSVTLEGDVYDPSGTLSGGSSPSGSGILIQVQDLLLIMDELNQAQRKLAALQAEEDKGSRKREEWRRMTRDLEMKEHELALVKQQIEGSSAARVGAQVEELKKTIAKLQDDITEAQKQQKAATDEVKKLEKDMAEFKNNKEGKTEQLKADIVKQKATLQKESVKVKTQQKEVQTAKLELEQFDQDIADAEARLEEARSSVEKARKELAKMQDTVARSEAAHNEAEERLQEERATLSRFDNELKQLASAIKEKKSEMGKADVRLTELEHEVATLHKDLQACFNTAKNLEKQYEWIVEDKDQFGKPGTPYDFTSVNIKDLRDQADKEEATQRGMKKKVNHKVLSTLDSTEKREAELQKNLRTVLEDRGKIEETIDQLDQYKREALMKTWKKVDSDFGAIFAELLPGNFAKLQPPEGQDLMDGLEVKVRLGSVWKQSLTELSGGQRSLIALSLIMSLLQFKPAPMYILDEIDAALDLSHTQHIGQLFRTRFKGSQFIVVSLKEGLFTNANVLFKAKFSNGTSLVDRTVQRSGSSMYANGEDDHVEGRGSRRRANGQ